MKGYIHDIRICYEGVTTTVEAKAHWPIAKAENKMVAVSRNWPGVK